MIKVPPLEEWGRRYYRGMSNTPAMPCKHCGRKTRAWWGKGKCQFCGGDLPYSEAVSLARKLGLR